MSDSEVPVAKQKISFFLRDLDGGGAERAIVFMAGEIAKRGYIVDFVVGDAESDYRAEVSELVNVVDFCTKSPYLAFVRLIGYLRTNRPAVIMSALDVANVLLILAAKIACFRGGVVISQRAVLGASLRGTSYGRKFLTEVLRRACYPFADAVISNSYAASEELSQELGVSSENIFTIHNAVDAEKIEKLASEKLSDSYKPNNQIPLVLSVGSLTKRKDMETLIKAFAIVRAQRVAHLAIIGKGPEKQNLESLISVLKITDSVHLLGFDVNPFKWMALAKVFVSSSTEEGFPNVIAEALALEINIVATDCPGDTRELLEHGKWGSLVPVGDVVRMAEKIIAALDDDNNNNGLNRISDFSPSVITDAYLKVLLSKANTVIAGIY